MIVWANPKHLQLLVHPSYSTKSQFVRLLARQIAIAQDFEELLKVEKLFSKESLIT